MSDQNSSVDIIAELTQQLATSEAAKAEAQAYQHATSEILQVMVKSLGNVTPVFAAIV